MSEKLNIEKLFISKLEGIEQTPSPTVWKNTARKVQSRQFFRFKPWRFNIYSAGTIAILGAILTYSLITKGEKGSAQMPESNTQEQTNQLPGTASEQALQEKANQDIKQQSDPVFKDQNQHNSQTITAEDAEQESGTVLDKSNKLQKTASQGSEIYDPEYKVQPPATVSTLIPYFTPSVYDGCAPLTVEFVNTTVNASSISWNFGIQENDQISPKPVVTYASPGTYMVTLTAVDAEGMQKSHSETITVYPKPGAVFEIDQGSIYNYSIDANEFKWFVIPEEAMKRTIEQSQPISTNFQPSLSGLLEYITSRNIINPCLLMVAKNSFGCVDTASLPLPSDSNLRLVFPTAFSPSPHGSIGGYYNLNDPDNQVFHPKFEDVPEQYHLTIYNKVGTLVFETSDIYIGWDGYYREAPAPRGVYIYQCTGKWKNGDIFQYRGDITILWNEL